MAKRYMRADEILRALHKKHVDKRRPDTFFTQVKNGRTQAAKRGELRILDGLAIRKSWTQPCFTAYEVKVSRSDFMGDTKWTDYLPLCHELVFACPSGLIQPEEIGEEVGLIWCNPETHTLTTRKKAVFRRIEISQDMLYYIIMSQIDDDRHPFFSSERERLEAWLDDKESRRSMAYAVQGKLWDQLAEQERKIEDLERKVKSTFDNPKRRLEEVEGILQDAGIDTNRWGWRHDLKDILSQGISTEIKRGIDRVEQAASQLRRTVERYYADTEETG